MFAKLRIVLLMSVMAMPMCAQVKVYVWQENRVDDYVFHYRVVNSSAHAVVKFEVGRAMETDRKELVVDPRGFSPDEDLAAPDDLSIPIPLDGAVNPVGWKAGMVVEEESSESSLAWRVLDLDHTILPGATLSGFAVIVPSLDSNYRVGHWVANLDNGVRESGRLLIDSVEAPKPSATLSGEVHGCSPVSGLMQATLTGNGPWSLSWSDGYALSGVSESLVQRQVTVGTTTTFTVWSVRDVNVEGTVAGKATFTLDNPVIVRHPQGTVIAKGNSVVLTVLANTGLIGGHFQWYEGSSGNVRKRVGSDSAQFSTPSLRKTTSYWVRVGNSCGSVNSYAATIQVQ